LKYNVIDNFLAKQDLVNLQNIVLGNDFPWFYQTGVAYEGSTNVANVNKHISELYKGGIIANPTLDEFNQFVDKKDIKNEWEFFLSHSIYGNNVIQTHTNIWSFLTPVFEKLGLKSLIRIKANCYTKSYPLIEHDLHKDFDYSHNGCILSLNTNNGYTLLEDGTKIESVENRALFLDAGELHASTSTTDTERRVNLSLNYF
jgi:hypothetical protein